MKKLALITALLLLTGGVTAVVGYDGPEDKPHIMSGGASASSTAAVSPNGTEYRSTVKMDGRSPNITEDVVRNLNYSENKLSFEGSIQASTPCHLLEQDVEKTGNQSYVLDIQTVQDNSSEVCAQQAVMINYEAEFEEEPSYQLKVNHDGEKVREISNPPVHKDEVSNPIAEILDWFGKLL